MRKAGWMRLRVEKLRWGLLAAGGSLLLLVAGLLAYSRYQALRSWHRILERTGGTLTRDTSGFTYSQSLGGRTVFTLHAAKAAQGKDGKYALHDVALTLYRPANGAADHDRADHIYGSDFEYDQKAGVARALGEVHMDLQAPGAIRHDKGPAQGGPAADRDQDRASRAGEAPDASPEDQPETVHVKTSGLVYVRNLGVAATDQDVEFRYGGLECHSRGAEFDSGQSTVHLLADVQMNGQIRGQAVSLTAARADIDRKSNVATLNRAEVRAEGATASALSAIVHLRPDGSPSAGEANGSVRMTHGTQLLTAAHAEARMGEGTTVQEARFSGAVRVEDRDPLRPLQAHAERVQASFGPHGAVETATAEGAAWVQFFDRAAGGAGLRREASGERMNAEFSDAASRAGTKKSQPELKRVKIAGKASMSGEAYVKATPGAPALVAGEATSAAGVSPASAGSATDLRSETRVAAEALVVNLVQGAQGKPEPQSIEGTTNTVLEQKLPGRFERRSTGDRLTMQLSEGPVSAHLGPAPAPATAGGAGLHLASAVQEGHVGLRSFTVASSVGAQGQGKEQTTEGSAQRAEFKAESERVFLTGEVRLRSEDGDLAAAKVDLNPQTGDAVAQGQVLATLTRSANAGASGGKAPEATHVLASSARFSRKAGTAEFYGTDAQPVRMWQGASQIEAATLLLDQQRSSLEARPAAPGGVVRCVFAAGNEAAGEKKSTPKTPATPLGTPGAGNVLRVSSARLDYTGTAHEALFTGGVRTSGALGEVHSERATVFLQAQEKGAGPAQVGAVSSPKAASDVGLLGGAVDRVVVSGHVQLEQPGRSGTGDQLLYTAANSSFVLTGSPGKPPHMVDAQQGSITGTTLLFRTGDNSIVAAGDPSAAGKVHGRVRTELNLHP